WRPVLYQLSYAPGLRRIVPPRFGHPLAHDRPAARGRRPHAAEARRGDGRAPRGAGAQGLRRGRGRARRVAAGRVIRCARATARARRPLPAPRRRARRRRRRGARDRLGQPRGPPRRRARGARDRPLARLRRPLRAPSLRKRPRHAVFSTDVSRADETQTLWLQYRRTRDQALRDRLILTYAPLVKYVAGRRGKVGYVVVLANKGRASVGAGRVGLVPRGGPPGGRRAGGRVGGVG